MTVSAFTPHDEFAYRTARQEFPFLTGVVKAYVLRTTWTPDTALDKVFGDVSAHEADDGDYAAITLTGKVINQDGNGRTVYDSADFDYGDNVSVSGQYVLIAIEDADPAKCYIFGHWDCNEGGGDLSSVADDFDFKVNALGIYRWTP